MNLAFPRFYDDKELSIAVKYNFFYDQKIKIKFFSNGKEVPDDFVPIGTVSFLEEYLGQKIIPDYYPEFLIPFLGRKIWKVTELSHVDKFPVAIKPSDEYKRFNLKIVNSASEITESPPFFVQKLRHLRMNGVIM